MRDAGERAQALYNQWADAFSTALENSTSQQTDVDGDVQNQARNTDSQGNKLTEAQQEYFKDSKVRDKDGNLLVVRHGTDADFNVFDFSKSGKNGKAEGYGFYFSDDPEITNKYGAKQKEVYLNITKPLYNNKRTINKAELIKLTNALIDFDVEKYKDEGLTWQDSFLSNYVMTYDMTRQSAVREFVNQIWNYNTTDQDLVFEIAQGDGRYYDSSTMKEFYEVLTASIGYDGIIAEWEHEGGTSNVYVTFESNQSKNTTNTNPTADPDIRYQARTSEKNSIKQQIRANLDSLNKLDAVMSIEFTKNEDKKSLREKAQKEFSKIGFKVDRQGFGIIHLGEKQISDSLNYINTDAEKAALMTVPRVLKRGIEIGEHSDHKTRNVRTITFSAPVLINGTRGNVAVVVKQTTKNTYHAHRILLPDGSEFEFIDSKKRNAELTSGEERINSDTKRTPIGSTFSKYTIPQESSSVKENISDTQAQVRRRRNKNYLDVESRFGVAESVLKYAETVSDPALKAKLKANATTYAKKLDEYETESIRYDNATANGWDEMAAIKKRNQIIKNKAAGSCGFCNLIHIFFGDMCVEKYTYDVRECRANGAPAKLVLWGKQRGARRERTDI